MSDPYERGEPVVWKNGGWVSVAKPAVEDMQPAPPPPPRHHGPRWIDCWRCFGERKFDTTAIDEHGDNDAHCISCGARNRPPAAVAAILEAERNKQRRRQPTHGRVKL